MNRQAKKIARLSVIYKHDRWKKSTLKKAMDLWYYKRFIPNKVSTNSW